MKKPSPNTTTISFFKPKRSVQPSWSFSFFIFVPVPDLPSLSLSLSHLAKVFFSFRLLLTFQLRQCFIRSCSFSSQRIVFLLRRFLQPTMFCLRLRDRKQFVIVGFFGSIFDPFICFYCWLLVVGHGTHVCTFMRVRMTTTAQETWHQGTYVKEKAVATRERFDRLRVSKRHVHLLHAFAAAILHPSINSSLPFYRAHSFFSRKTKYQNNAQAEIFKLHFIKTFFIFRSLKYKFH